MKYLMIIALATLIGLLVDEATPDTRLGVAAFCFTIANHFKSIELFGRADR